MFGPPAPHGVGIRERALEQKFKSRFAEIYLFILKSLFTRTIKRSYSFAYIEAVRFVIAERGFCTNNLTPPTMLRVCVCRGAELSTEYLPIRHGIFVRISRIIYAPVGNFIFRICLVPSTVWIIVIACFHLPFPCNAGLLHRSAT